MLESMKGAYIMQGLFRDPVYLYFPGNENRSNGENEVHNWLSLQLLHQNFELHDNVYANWRTKLNLQLIL